MKVRVYLVDDHRLLVAGVRAELPAEFSIVGSAYDVDTAIEEIRGLNPDVVLIDVHMPDGGGIAVFEGVADTNPEVKFLALSVSDQAKDVVAMIRTGARGYVTKTIEPSDLTGAVRRVHAGDAVFSPRLAGFVLDAFAGAIPTDEEPERDRLTSREKDVLRLIARGFAYKQVAHKLNISIKTVETHVSSVLRTLQLSSRHELARWASRVGSCNKRRSMCRVHDAEAVPLGVLHDDVVGIDRPFVPVHLRPSQWISRSTSPAWSSVYKSRWIRGGSWRCEGTRSRETLGPEPPSEEAEVAGSFDTPLIVESGLPERRLPLQVVDTDHDRTDADHCIMALTYRAGSLQATPPLNTWVTLAGSVSTVMSATGSPATQITSAS